IGPNPLGLSGAGLAPCPDALPSRLFLPISRSRACPCCFANVRPTAAIFKAWLQAANAMATPGRLWPPAHARAKKHQRKPNRNDAFTHIVHSELCLVSDAWPLVRP